MKLKGLIIVVLALSCTTAFAQFRKAKNNDDSEGPSVLDRIYFGGGGGFGAGTSQGYSYNYYSLFPIVGYKVTPQFSAGLGFNYLHYSYPDLSQTYTQYGFMPFVKYNINQLFFQVEYDYINSPVIDYNTGYTETIRKYYDRLLFGIGYSQPLGRRSSVNALLMYDVLYSQPSVFSSPLVVRVFFTF